MCVLPSRVSGLETLWLPLQLSPILCLTSSSFPHRQSPCPNKGTAHRRQPPIAPASMGSMDSMFLFAFKADCTVSIGSVCSDSSQLHLKGPLLVSPCFLALIPPWLIEAICASTCVTVCPIRSRNILRLISSVERKLCPCYQRGTS